MMQNPNQPFSPYPQQYPQQYPQPYPQQYPQQYPPQPYPQQQYPPQQILPQPYPQQPYPPQQIPPQQYPQQQIPQPYPQQPYPPQQQYPPQPYPQQPYPPQQIPPQQYPQQQIPQQQYPPQQYSSPQAVVYQIPSEVNIYTDNFFPQHEKHHEDYEEKKERQEENVVKHEENRVIHEEHRVLHEDPYQAHSFFPEVKRFQIKDGANFSFKDDVAIYEESGKRAFVFRGEGKEIIFLAQSNPHSLGRIIETGNDYKIYRSGSVLHATVFPKFGAGKHKFEIEMVDSSIGREIKVDGDWHFHDFHFEKYGNTFAKVYGTSDGYGVEVQPGEDCLLILATIAIMEMTLRK